MAASWGDCGGGLAPRVPSLKELMALPCTMQPRRLMNIHGRAPRLFIRHLCSSMVLSLVASWGDCGGCLAPRVPSLKELMVLPCAMQSCHLMKNCGRAPRFAGEVRTRGVGSAQGARAPRPRLEHKCESGCLLYAELKLENCGGGKDLKIHPGVLRVSAAILTPKISSN